jgi:succinate dehydrogenase / fumarate reductase membrane anchor subunit
MDLRTPLGKVKGLGSAHSGTHHWLMQRLTAIALIPLVAWFVCLVIKASVNAEQLLDYMYSPLNAIAMVLFLGVSLYHGALGMKVIIEDYVHCPCGKFALVTLMNFVAVVTAVVAIVAVIKFHVAPTPEMKMERALGKYEQWQQNFSKRLKALNGHE